MEYVLVIRMIEFIAILVGISIFLSIIYLCYRYDYLSHNKRMIKRIMRNMAFMNIERIDYDFKYLSFYQYTDKNNDYHVYEIKTCGNNLYSIYKRSETNKDKYELVVTWKYNEFNNILSKIFNIEVKKGFKFEDMKEWI